LRALSLESFKLPFFCGGQSQFCVTKNPYALCAHFFSMISGLNINKKHYRTRKLNSMKLAYFRKLTLTDALFLKRESALA
jgi:hypothetical protein